MIRMNLKSNIYREEYHSDGSEIFYIGQGLPGQGHQKEERGNKRILDNRELDIHFFVQTKEQRSGYWTYTGIWEVADYVPDYETDQMTPDGEKQRVFRFRLVEKTDRKEEFKTENLSHWDVIGIITELGNRLGYMTYVADKKKKYEEKSLGDIASLQNIPKDYTGFKQIDRIDAIWISETPPLVFFEVEYKSTMRGALHRLYQVRLLNAQLIVVGPKENYEKFQKWVDTAPFSSIKERYTYRSYEDLLAFQQIAYEYQRIKEGFLGD